MVPHQRIQQSVGGTPGNASSLIRYGDVTIPH